MAVVDAVGYYKGLYWRRQRICDVLVVESRARWYFTYKNDFPTGDHFRTIKAMKEAIDNEEICQ